MNTFDLTTYQSFLHSLFRKYRKECPTRKFPRLYLGHTIEQSDNPHIHVNVEHYVGCENNDFVEIIERNEFTGKIFTNYILPTEREITTKPISTVYQFKITDNSCSDKSHLFEQDTIYQTYQKMKYSKLWEESINSGMSQINATFKIEFDRLLHKCQEANNHIYSRTLKNHNYYADHWNIKSLQCNGEHLQTIDTFVKPHPMYEDELRWDIAEPEEVYLHNWKEMKKEYEGDILVYSKKYQKTLKCMEDDDMECLFGHHQDYNYWTKF